jgi:RNA polymerase sigma factor (sigma-70 family)
VPDPNPLAALVRRLNPGPADVPDADLLDRFVRSADQAAFELLVWRHGAMVWGACRRVLGPDRAAAEDACQAAFVALARHAARLRGRGAVGAWLHRVAVRASIDLGRAAARQRSADYPDPPARDPDPFRQASDREVRALLDTGLDRLPDKLRVPFVLCELEGRSNAEAAAALGCPVGTVESRLTRARHRLREFLTARGVVPAVAAAAAAVPEPTRAAMARAADPLYPSAAVKALAARAIPPAVSAKARAVLAAGLVLAAGALGLGVVLAQDPGDQPPPPPQPTPRDEVVTQTRGLEGVVGSGDVVTALVVVARATRNGHVLFVVRPDAPDRGKTPAEWSVAAAVDGKEVRAVAADGRPLDHAELGSRLSGWKAVVVFPADLGLPDAPFRSVLAERGVIFLLPRALYTPMANAAGARRKPDDVRP